MRKNLVLFIILLLLIPTTVFADGTDARVQISGDVIVQADEVIMGDAITIMGNVTVDGKVTGDVVAIFGDVIVNGEVMGDVTAVGGRIIRGETSKVYGKVTEVKISGIADIANIIKRQGINMGQYNWNFARNWRYSWFRTVRFLGILAVGIFFVILFPNSIKTASAVVENQVARKILIGFITFILTPIMVLLLAVTIIGIPLIPIMLLLLYAAGLFGYICISIYLGRRLNEQFKFKPKILLEFVLGAILLKLIQLVPLIGSLTSILILIMSLGITVETRFGTQKPIQ